MEHSHLLLSESQNVRFSFPLCINDLEPSSAQGSTCPFHVSSISNLSIPAPAPPFALDPVDFVYIAVAPFFLFSAEEQ